MYHETFTMFAAYNAWSNERLYGVAAGLSEAEFRADRGLFFGSVMATLNHLLATDRIWMRRFTGAGEAPDRLDAILHPDFAALRDARVAEDARIRDWIAGTAEADFSEPLTYRPISNPTTVTQPLAPVVFHLFNHQTHHRGQAHAALTGLGRSIPPLDLAVFQRESGLGLGRDQL